eukprot:219541-Prorocentrum_lima.AAC.1
MLNQCREAASAEEYRLRTEVPARTGSNHLYKRTSGSQSSTSGGKHMYRDEPDRIQRKASKACNM